VSLRHVEDGADDGIVAEINVTPLTDIFLVLLIIFMVTSTALVQQGTRVNLPKARGGASTASGVIITATADRQLAVNGKSVAPAELEAAVREALLATAEQSVILQGDRSVVLEDAVRIMTAAKAAGAERIAIATEAEAGGKQP
jgi:biopolymer transport protein ExbD